MSWIEVESKINLKGRNISEVRQRIKQIAKFVKIEHKKDDYYSLEYFDYPQKSLRVREAGKILEVNFKKRGIYKKGVHAKTEVQFRVSDLKGFYNLIRDFGFRKWLHKEKETELYKTADGVSIELNKVKRLGWFIELEVLCPKKDIIKARQKIVKTRNLLGFTIKDVEKKGYTKQLWELKHKS